MAKQKLQASPRYIMVIVAPYDSCQHIELNFCSAIRRCRIKLQNECKYTSRQGVKETGNWQQGSRVYMRANLIVGCGMCRGAGTIFFWGGGGKHVDMPSDCQNLGGGA